MNHLKLLLAGFCTVAVIGCAGGTKLQKASTDDMPDWYLNPPANTADFMYSVNSQSSQDMQIAVDKASTGARAEMQRQVESNIQAMQKKFNDEIGTGADATLL